MALQKILNKKYIERIFEEVERGEGLERFLYDIFPYDETQLLVTPQVKEPVGLIERMVPTPEGDFQSAVALYDAYKSLKPLQAINVQFWESLTLTDLFPYMQKPQRIQRFAKINYQPLYVQVSRYHASRTRRFMVAGSPFYRRTA